jgi:CBS domain-containing protein
VQQLMASMTVERYRHVVVVDGGEIQGVVSVGDLVKHRLQQLETETGVLRDYVAARRLRI